MPNEVSLVTPFRGTTFHSHTVHNPNCDILVGHIDQDTDMTYGRYLTGPNAGEEFMEYYRGPNYVHRSTKNSSYSRRWKPINIPVKYFCLWQLLRSVYAQQHFLTTN
jgi:hypothetical protein